MLLSDLNTNDRKLAENMQAFCAAMMVHGRQWAVRGETETPFLDSVLENMMRQIFKLSRIVSDGKPDYLCGCFEDVRWNDDTYSVMAELLQPMGIELAKVLRMNNTSGNEIRTLDEMRAYCDTAKRRLPYHPSIMIYLKGNLEAIVKELKDPEIYSDIEIIQLYG